MKFGKMKKKIKYLNNTLKKLVAKGIVLVTWANHQNTLETLITKTTINKRISSRIQQI